jgi:hypothetical protein
LGTKRTSQSREERLLSEGLAVLKMQINKSDRSDAVGIARIVQTGWFKEVRVKDLDCHAVKACRSRRPWRFG